MLANIQSQLTSAVQSGKMTQTQETNIYNKMQQNIDSGVVQVQSPCIERMKTALKLRRNIMDER